MGAVNAAVAGAIAGNIQRKQLLSKIDKTFDSPEMREQAKIILDLIQEGDGSVILSIIFFILGVPSIYFGIYLSGALNEIVNIDDIIGKNQTMLNIVTIISCSSGFILLSIIMFLLDKYLYKIPARKRLENYVNSCPQGKSIEKTVREILK